MSQQGRGHGVVIDLPHALWCIDLRDVVLFEEKAAIQSSGLDRDCARFRQASIVAHAEELQPLKNPPNSGPIAAMS